jgi:hypothetical protein
VFAAVTSRFILHLFRLFIDAMPLYGCLTPYCDSATWITIHFTNSELQLYAWNLLQAVKHIRGFYKRNKIFCVQKTVPSLTNNEEIIIQLKFGLPFRVYIKHFPLF